MASITDLHTHSTFSDGVLTPSDLVNFAYSRGVRIMALTDHDVTDGLQEAIEAASHFQDFTLIPGIEMSTDVPGSEVHLLGYFLDPTDGIFQDELARMRRSRLDRGRMMVEALRELGLPIKWERVQEIAGPGAVGRPHIAQALVEANYVETVVEAFDRYLSRNGPAYVERTRHTPEQVVQIIQDNGGFCCLAHPRELEDLKGLVTRLTKAGLVAIDVYYQDYQPQDMARLLSISNRFGLLPLGGSDYHGLGGTHQREPGDIPLPQEPVQRLFQMAHDHGVADRVYPEWARRYAVPPILGH